MKKIAFMSALLLSGIISANIYAEGIKFDKPFTTTATITSPNNTKFANAKKQVTLMSIRLTDKQRRALLTFKPIKNTARKTRSDLPSSVYLEMNDVPVLDQGMHGSCVTFAVTAAIDAVLGKKDHISQLCQLELGSYLKYKGYYESGWNGATAPIIYDQMLRFGVVSKQKQKTSGCAGVKSYPVNSFNEGNLMDTDEYRYLSEDISESLHAHTLMDEFERITVLFSDDSDEDQTAIENTMDSIKTALNNGNRVTFGAFLVLAPSCSVGACVSNKQTQDTWAITNEVRQTHENDRFAVGGHEMVITGYDDTATVVDKNGMTHTGLLKLRNSWGEEVGDSGNFYMTYEYFKKFALEAHEVVNLNMSSKK